MPVRNTAFANFPVPPYQQRKKPIRAAQRSTTPVQEIPENREKRRYRGCLIGACVGAAITAVILLAALLPLLIITLTRSSTSSAAASDTDTGMSSTTYSNGTTISSVTSISSTTYVRGSVSAGSNASITTSGYAFTVSGAVGSATSLAYRDESLSISCSVNLINITVTVTVQKIVNVTYRGDTNTFWSGVLSSTHNETGSQIIYIWTINNGQTIQSSGSPYSVLAQFYLPGINQTTSTDTYQVTATTVNGLTNTISGTF